MDYKQAISEAQRHVANGNGNDGLPALSQILAEHAWLGEVAAMMGKIHFLERRYGLAEAYFSFGTILQSNNFAISSGRFLSLWEGGNIEAALMEIDRFSQAGKADAYDELMKSFVVCLDEALGPPEGEGGELSLENPGAYSRTASGLQRRYHRDRNPIDHLDGLRRKQQMIRNKQTDGIIDETKKSEQDVKSVLDRIRSRADLDDTPVTKVRVARKW